MIQRGGPSTGMPTKTDQADLLQVHVRPQRRMPGRDRRAGTPADCFDMAIEAFRIAVKHMTPVDIPLGRLSRHGAEPWRIPDIADLPEIEVTVRQRPCHFPALPA